MAAGESRAMAGVKPCAGTDRERPRYGRDL